jgi:hypothetical protein
VSEETEQTEQTEQTDGQTEQTDGQTNEPVRYQLRRAPKYLPFGVTGALLGVLAGLALALSNPVSGDYSERTIIGYFAAILGLVGALAGLGVAVLIERRR